MILKEPLSSVFREIYYQELNKPSEVKNKLISNTKDSLDYLQRLGLQCRFQIHSGCVNTVCWNNSGEYILSGSDDQFIAITNPHNQQVLLKYKTAHRANIFSARFMPQSNDRAIVSCSGDGIVLHTELMAPYLKRKQNQSHYIIPAYEHCDKEANLNFFNCHKSGTTYEVLTVPSEPRSFMSCGEDGTVRLFDLRQISSCHKTCCKDNILIFSPSAITAMSLAPITNQYIAVGSSDSIIRVYDRRYLSLIDFSNTTTPGERYTIPVKAYPIPTISKRTYRVTSVKYSSDESDLLVSYSSDHLYLFDLKKEGVGVNELCTKKSSSLIKNTTIDGQQITRKLRLRGDWSDTGPDARPERDPNGRVEIGQVRPQLQGNIMHRMTEVISRMLNDPRTRIGLTGQTNELSRENQSLFVSAARELRSEAAIASTSSYSESRVPSSSSAAHKEPLQTRRVSACTNVTGEHDEINEDLTNQQPSSSDSQFQEEASLNEELAKFEMEAKQHIFTYMKTKFMGHRNARTMIKEATFWGKNYVMSGSDCGHIFTWDRKTGKLVMLMQGDQHVVNCLQPHPELPYLATSGIDYDVKIWAPILQTSNFSEDEANDLIKRNAIMLEQTKDTITVPAAFMIRMLACIHSLRNRDRSNDESSTSNSTNNESSNPNLQSSDDSADTFDGPGPSTFRNSSGGL